METGSMRIGFVRVLDAILKRYKRLTNTSGRH